MDFPNSTVKIQSPKSKCYSMIAIPNKIKKFFAIEDEKYLCWLGVSIGNKNDNENIGIVFKVDKNKSIEEQCTRILRLFE